MPFNEAIGRLREAYPGLQPIVTDKHDVATSWKLPGAQGQVSFVSSMTAPFCGGCNRLRLTADGNIKTCLFGNDELSLRDALREGATEPELLRLVWAALQGKHARHAGEALGLGLGLGLGLALGLELGLGLGLGLGFFLEKAPWEPPPTARYER